MFLHRVFPFFPCKLRLRSMDKKLRKSCSGVLVIMSAPRRSVSPTRETCRCSINFIVLIACLLNIYVLKYLFISCVIIFGNKHLRKRNFDGLEEKHSAIHTHAHYCSFCLKNVPVNEQKIIGCIII